MDRDVQRWQVTLRDHTVLLTRETGSKSVVASVLGVERDAAGAVTAIWCDRRVHDPRHMEFPGWWADGAVVTVFRRSAAGA